MKNKRILRIIQQVNNFKDLEQKIFKVVCQQAQDALKDVLILIDDKLMEHRIMLETIIFMFYNNIKSDFHN